MSSFKIRKAVAGMAGFGTVPLALMLAAGAVHAQDADSMFSYSGFGTVGATRSSSSQGDFASSLYQRSGAGASRSWDVGTDTKLGAQAVARFSDRLTGVVQVVAMARSDNTYNPRFEWANLQYAFTPDFKVRVGRTALPTFMVSDTRLVGYANTWVRPPVEVYSDIPMTNLDGVDASYKSHFGSVINTLQVYAGRTDINTVDERGQKTPTTTIRRAIGFSDTVETGAWTARLGYLQSDVTFALAPGFDLKVAQKSYSVGAAYDPGSWFIQGEFTSVRLPGFTPTVNGSYLTGGYRLGNFTPYAIYAKGSSSNTPALVSYDQKTASVGVRWDAMKNVAVKLQADRIEPLKGTAGYFTNVRPGLVGSKVNLVTVAVDFVF